MIEIKNVNFGYEKGKTLFSNVNLEWKEGHLYGLLGRNGTGKSTLLKLMSGILFPNAGEILIDGKNSSKRRAEQLQSICFLQEEIYAPHLKISQYEAAFSPFYPDFKHDKFKEYLDVFELSNDGHFIDKMSHGQKKKVMIAFSLATDTPILVMDEPTNGLDIPAKSTFRKLMANYTDDNKIVIISTHQVRDLHSLIDSVTILDSGKILLNASVGEITDKILFDVDNEKSSDGKLFYTEETPRGIYQVKENVHNLDSNLDLELLFNAALQNDKNLINYFNNL